MRECLLSISVALRPSREQKKSALMNDKIVAIRSGPLSSDEDADERLLQNQSSNVYDDIDGADEDEDGDDMIAHYGSTQCSKQHSGVDNSGYVIRNNVL